MSKYTYVTINDKERTALQFVVDYLLKDVEVNATTLAVRLTIEKLLQRSKHLKLK